ncbi:MAG TPA: heparan-alpha-glucosaminide N-acetyltransferase domain-containing protein [Luteolibacter sp.]|nr:heparan-alpha-glucosaminide N-acetyltransferase domain-containing protein [Luteolibacter sp.]
MKATAPAADPSTPESRRIRFIDMARAVAILLMLEGHFIQVLLDARWHVRGQPFYETWLHIRGLAAPMFFTTTGLIFAYLLAKSPIDRPLLEVTRVRRGLMRVPMLLGWGYLLQLNLRYPPHWPLPHDSWLLGFHVLQCIAVGLLLMIGVHAVLRRMDGRLTIAAFCLLGVGTFLFAVVADQRDGWMPAEAPSLIQNAIKGPRSHFPVMPWLGFTFYGAALGTWTGLRQRHGRPMPHPAALIGTGAVLTGIGWHADQAAGRALLEWLGHQGDPRLTSCFFHSRLGEALLLIGLLAAIERFTRIPTARFETIGRHTLVLYVAHVILLYGGITGLGLQEIPLRLNPWQAVLGALLFCGLFAIGAQWIEPLLRRYRALATPNH